MSQKITALELEGLSKIIKIIDEAPRLGGEHDEPEGTRYIQISDTLSNLMSAYLHQLREVLKEDIEP